MVLPSEPVVISPDGNPDHVEITVRVGETRTLAFQERSTTGYLWSLTTPDTPIVTVREELAAGDLPGACSLRRYFVEGYRAGHGDLCFQLARPWMPDTPLSTVRMTVRVVD